jgi:hypothetical protein
MEGPHERYAVLIVSSLDFTTTVRLSTRESTFLGTTNICGHLRHPESAPFLPAEKYSADPEAAPFLPAEKYSAGFGTVVSERRRWHQATPS